MIRIEFPNWDKDAARVFGAALTEYSILAADNDDGDAEQRTHED